MAAIDWVGNTVVVHAAGTMSENIPHVDILSANVWWASTAGDLQIVEITTGAILVRRFTPDGSAIAPFSEWVSMEGRYGRLSFNVVTACTLTFTVA